MRVTAVLTHPTQYFTPWFRFIAASEPSVALTVLYGSVPTPSQQATGFGGAFTWDDDLLVGYDARVLRPSADGDEFSSEAKRGIDAPTIGDELDRSAPDVVLVFGWHAPIQRRAIAHARRRDVPLLYRGDSNIVGGRSILRSLRRRWLLRAFTAYLSVGTRSREFLLAHGVDPARIFDSPHAVDGARFASASPMGRSALGLRDDAYVVLYVGKLEEKKRVLDLVAAMRVLPDAQLLVVGSGPEEAACRAAAGPNVIFAGFRNQSELGAIYRTADVLALPSDARETWGLVVNEALACGVPCVVSDEVGCAVDLVIPGVTGARHAVGDVAGIARALRAVRGRDLARSCREHVATHSFAAATVGLVAAARASGSALRR